MKASDIAGSGGIMLRESDDQNSLWKSVKIIEYCAEKLPSDIPGQPHTQDAIVYLIITFDDGTQRVLDLSDDIEVGRIAPRWISGAS